MSRKQAAEKDSHFFFLELNQQVLDSLLHRGVYDSFTAILAKTYLSQLFLSLIHI